MNVSAIHGGILQQQKGDLFKESGEENKFIPGETLSIGISTNILGDAERRGDVPRQPNGNSDPRRAPICREDAQR
jgi:hypothetical protein